MLFNLFSGELGWPIRQSMGDEEGYTSIHQFSHQSIHTVQYNTVTLLSSAVKEYRPSLTPAIHNTPPKRHHSHRTDHPHPPSPPPSSPTIPQTTSPHPSSPPPTSNSPPHFRALDPVPRRKIRTVVALRCVRCVHDAASCASGAAWDPVDGDAEMGGGRRTGRWGVGDEGLGGWGGEIGGGQVRRWMGMGDENENENEIEGVG